MPEVDQKVMSFVERALTRNPKIQLEDLFERAKKAHDSIRKLSKRQFNARYPLQVKRRRSQASKSGSTKGKRGRPAPAPKPGPRPSKDAANPRDAVRQVFLQFATDITGADERKDLVKVLANVDKYVDQVMKGVKKG